MARFLITLFLGWAGIHKFMDKKIGMGILYLCTFGLFGIGWIIDIINSARNLSYTSIHTQSNTGTAANTILVAGTNYKKNEISSIMSGNPIYNLPDNTFIQKTEEYKRIYRFKYRRSYATLIPEPTNPHDSNAIKVLIDNVHVGYIPSEQCSSVKKIMSHTCQMEASIHSGDYKYHSSGEVFKTEGNFLIELHM